MRPLTLLIVCLVALELVFVLRAWWEVGCRRYESVLIAWLATNVLFVGWLFMAIGGLVLKAPWERGSGIMRRLVGIVAETMAWRYWWLHDRLESSVAIGEARMRRQLRQHKPAAIGPPKVVTAAAILPPGAEVPTRTGDRAPESSLPAVRGVEFAVKPWHGRIVSISLGLVAGVAVAAVVWLSGLNRAPGAAEHAVVGIGRLRLLIGLCVVGGLALGVVAHRETEGGGRVNDGMARRRDIRRALSTTAVRKSTAITRPGLPAKRLPPNHSGTFLGWRKGKPLWATLKDVVLVLAPPQTGKTAWLGGRIIDAPGSVVATSTKADIYVHTADLRAARGPLWVLNIDDLGGIPTNFRWSPLEGCTNPRVASKRAGYLLAGVEKGGGDAHFWRDMNLKLLRCLLLAAAVSGRDMRDVWSWVNDSTDRTPLLVLQEDPTVPRGWTSELAQIMNDAPERTRQSVYLTLAQAMQFVTHPDIEAVVCPTEGEPTFSLERFLASGATLYLLGSDDLDGSFVPLFTAIVGHIFDGAKQVAGRSRDGRFDPPLTLALDEAALICPVPLQSMTADSGGRGIQVLMAVQSPSQLYERWGHHGGKTIYNNANARLVFGGLAHAEDLTDLSRVCGERDERVRGTTTGSGGHHSSSMNLRKVPVLAPHEIRQIPDGHALLLYRNVPPAVVKVEKVWERKDVKAAAKARRAGKPLVRPKMASVRRPVRVAATPPHEVWRRQMADVDNIIVLADRRGTEGGEDDGEKAAVEED